MVIRTIVIAAFALAGTTVAVHGCAHHACDHNCDTKHETHHGHADNSHNGHAGEAHNAANVTEHVDQVFAALDADGDKVLSREEVTGHRLGSHFEEADADADGHITYEEMIAFGGRMHGVTDTAP